MFYYSPLDSNAFFAKHDFSLLYGHDNLIVYFAADQEKWILSNVRFEA